MRAFMVKEPEETSSKNAPKYFNAPAPSEDLPESMDVVIVSRSDKGEEHTTVIGRINMRTGEFKMLRNYDLKGRKMNGKAKAPGAYYGKKVLVK